MFLFSSYSLNQRNIHKSFLFFAWALIFFLLHQSRWTVVDLRFYQFIFVISWVLEQQPKINYCFHVLLLLLVVWLILLSGERMYVMRTHHCCILFFMLISSSLSKISSQEVLGCTKFSWYIPFFHCSWGCLAILA